MSTTVTIELHDTHAEALRAILSVRDEKYPGGLAGFYAGTVGVALEKVLKALPSPEEKLAGDITAELFREGLDVPRLEVVKKILELARERDASE